MPDLSPSRSEETSNNFVGKIMQIHTELSASGNAEKYPDMMKMLGVFPPTTCPLAPYPS